MSAWVGPRGDQWLAGIEPMEDMLAPVDEPLLGALDLRELRTVADLGCGGGGTSIAIARRAPTGTVVHGFDVSPALVAHARGRLGQDAHSLGFHVADLTSARPRTTYDRLVSRFGVMFFDDADAAFTNLARWLGPATRRGRFAFAVWGPARDNPWFTTVRDVVARFIELPAAAPNAPGPFRYGDARTLTEILARAGFDDLAVRDWRGALPVGRALSATDASRFALASFSSFGELLAAAGGDAFARAHHALTEAFVPLHRGGAVHLDARVHVVTGSIARG